MAAGVAVLVGLVAALTGLVASAPLAGFVAGAVIAVGSYVVATRRGPTSANGTGAPRVDELLERAGLSPDAGPLEVGSARDALVAARARRDQAGEERSRLAARRQELERSDRAVGHASAALAAAEGAWAEWLRAAGVPPDVSPDAARHILSAAGTARRAALDRDHHRRELAVAQEGVAAMAARTQALLATIGAEPAAGDAQRDARVAAVVERLERARADERRARDLDDRLAQLERRRAPAVERVEIQDAALRSHLAPLGCPDPDQLRRRATAAAERRALRAAARERSAQLALIAGSRRVEEVAADALSTDVAALEVAESGERGTLERIEAEERQATSRIGALEARIRQLESAEELGARRQELAILEGRAAAMAREWAVSALALRLLEETRARYERERQPDVVRAAETHFERITGGRYARIVAPPGDASVRVETEGGESLGTDELSRGTGEQLYLALRFGLIEEFARHGETLPVVMDDILVNFDVDRASRAASAIRDLAERHQVLYFTCHPWTAELLDPGGSRTLALA
jgi:uncharacterized protein YhaN